MNNNNNNNGLNSYFLRKLRKFNKNIEKKQIKDMEEIISMIFNVDVMLKGTRKTARGIRAFEKESTIKNIQRKVQKLSKSNPEKKKRRFGIFEKRIEPGKYYLRVPVYIWTKSFATKHVGEQYYTYKEKVIEMIKAVKKRFKLTLQSGNNGPNSEYIEFLDDHDYLYVKRDYRRHFFIIYSIQINDTIGFSMIKNNFAPITIPISSKRYSHGNNNAKIGKVVTSSGIISKTIPSALKKETFLKVELNNNNN